MDALAHWRCEAIDRFRNERSSWNIRRRINKILERMKVSRLLLKILSKHSSSEHNVSYILSVMICVWKNIISFVSWRCYGKCSIRTNVRLWFELDYIFTGGTLYNWSRCSEINQISKVNLGTFKTWTFENSKITFLLTKVSMLKKVYNMQSTYNEISLIM